MSKSANEIISSLQQIIINYAPSGLSSSAFSRAKDNATQLLQFEETTYSEKLTIIGLLPSDLVSKEIIIFLIETGSTKEVGLVKLIRKIVERPCTSVEEKGERREWLHIFLKKEKTPLATSDYATLSSAYINTFEDYQGDLSGEEISTIASLFLVCLQDALEVYAQEKYVFDTRRLRNLSYSTAADLLLHQQDVSIAALLERLRSSFSTDCPLVDRSFPEQHASLTSFINLFTKDIELYRYIRNSQEAKISFLSVQEILAGPGYESCDAAFDAFHDHKVVRYLIFVDKICKLDEVNKCIILNSQGIHDSVQNSSRDLSESLTEMKNLIVCEKTK